MRIHKVCMCDINASNGKGENRMEETKAAEAAQGKEAAQSKEEKYLYQVRTKIEPEDMRKFLYLETFRKRGAYHFFVYLVLDLAASFLVSQAMGLGAGGFLAFFLAYAVLIPVILVIKLERICKKRFRTDRAGLYNAWSNWEFYQDHVIGQNEAVQSSSVYRYEQFYQIIETKEYFLIYPNESMANLIRKRDIDGETMVGLQMLLREKMKARYRVL